MKERPILFSAPMVLAILDGRKTQTRRVCKPRYDDRKPCEHYKPSHQDDGVYMQRHCEHGSEGRGCQYGQTGDRLWVRETWAVRGLAWGMKPSQAAKIASPDAWRYAADDTTGWQHGWKPSIHMPRAASRITLEITGVRVERLQDISEDDAIAEGVGEFGEYVPEFDEHSPVPAYRALWESINGVESWDANPWVWVIEFKRIR